MKEKGN